jgi:glycosyltransferase involved in cell wall biosynthesis
MEAERKKIGIIFNFSPSWMGGVVYVMNIIKTLGHLESADKPVIVIFYNPNLKRFVEELDYPFLNKVQWQYPSVYKEFLRSFFKRKNTFVHEIVTKYELDAVFPLHDYPVKSKLDAKIVSWYADLQHKHYPEFFTRMKRIERDLRIRLILRNSKDLVVSSQAVKDDFLKFFRVPKKLSIHIYHFVSIIDKFPTDDFEPIRKQYNLPEDYFMISNQFHKHKNHKVAFEAIADLQKEGMKKNLVLTGKLPEDDGSVYVAELKKILTENELEDRIFFLGVLPRNTQLAIMKNATAIIQPSLFEGWSTVIEDAKSLQVPVIASDLKVNREQLGETAVYFEPHNAIHLAELMETAKKTDGDLYEDYKIRVKKAAYELFSIFN